MNHNIINTHFFTSEYQLSVASAPALSKSAALHIKMFSPWPDFRSLACIILFFLAIFDAQICASRVRSFDHFNGATLCWPRYLLWDSRDLCENVSIVRYPCRDIKKTNTITLESSSFKTRETNCNANRVGMALKNYLESKSVELIREVLVKH